MPCVLFSCKMESGIHFHRWEVCFVTWLEKSWLCIVLCVEHWCGALFILVWKVYYVIETNSIVIKSPSTVGRRTFHWKHCFIVTSTMFWDFHIKFDKITSFTPPNYKSKNRSKEREHCSRHCVEIEPTFAMRLILCEQSFFCNFVKCFKFNHPALFIHILYLLLFLFLFH